MNRNFFLVTLRNISRQKAFTFINITGLAIGLAASLLILLWVQDELSYDRFHEKGELIYRVEEDQFYSGERYHVTVTPHPSGPVWKEKIPEITEQARVNRLPRVLFRRNDNVFFESSIVTSDSGLFKMFTFPLILGDPETLLDSPHSIVLTKKLADKYFGDENPLGKTITVENRYQFMVTGVIKDMPENSIFTFEGIIPYSFMHEIGAVSDSWGNNSIFTFVELQKGANIEEVNKKLTDVVLEYNPETLTKFMVFPFLDIHLHAQFGFRETRGPVITVWIFSMIAVFILLIACINFINLSTAKASSRARETGIRKVLGADRKTMILHFMSESLILVALSMVLSLIIVGLSLELFNNVSGKEFTLSDLRDWKFIISFIATGIVAGIVSGLYPAFYLSSAKPVTTLKGDTMTGKGNGLLRKGLVVLQFTLSVVIAISAVFLYMQLMFMQNKDLGYDKENLIAIPMSEEMNGKYYSLKEELLKETLIQGVTAGLHNPVMMGSNSGGARWDGMDPERHVLIGTNAVDYDYLETMKMELVSGRSFSRDFTADMARDTTGNFLINEEVARLMGEDDPVGRNFRFMGLNGTIVGVLKNFHFKGADEPIEPMAFALADTSYLRVILVRLTPGKTEESLIAVEKTWKRIIPEYPLEYTFVDQDYQDLFRTETRLADLLRYFTVLALIIASLGLYGLSSYATERRTNEIGIRKVMGADSASVIYTMAMEFLGLVVIALAIAIPAGWYIVNRLLQQFAYRIDINVFIFILIAMGTLVLAALTVGYQAYRASCTNPATALKRE
ncbi:MAG: ABC transporter permease [Bacteroidales bacterium]|jgi:predicted permease|nr:ABC transporter permease [Bacteroidales bacterium]